MNTEAPVVAPPAPAVPPTAPVINLRQDLSSQAAKLTALYQAKGGQAGVVEPPAVVTPVEPVTPTTETVAPTEASPTGTAVLTPSVPVEPAPVTTAPIIEDDDDEPATPAPVNLGTPTEYVMGRLPTLTTRIMDGETQKIVQFKDPSELPIGFKFADDTAASQFAMDAAAQVTRADKLLTEYNNSILQQNIQAFQTQEDQDVATDLARLQRQGVIPTFKFEESDPNFNTDPAVKTANEIYDLFKKTNEAYAKRYANSNRTFRISYADAADKYFAAQNRANASQVAKDQPAPAPKPAEKTAAQKEREQVARQTGSPASAEATNDKPKVKAGMSFDDINRLARAGRI